MPGTTVVTATIVGLEPDHVRVTERQYPNADAEPVVMIELGGNDTHDHNSRKTRHTRIGSG
jgi:hypothetical protein